MRAELSALGASHGRFEREGSASRRVGATTAADSPWHRRRRGRRARSRGSLDDSDREIRRKAAGSCISSAVPRPSRADTGARTRRIPSCGGFCARSDSTRRGGSACPGLLGDTDIAWRRRAALALGEAGDAHAGPLLVEWWQHGGKDDHDRALDILGALGRIRLRTRYGLSCTRSGTSVFVRASPNARHHRRLVGTGLWSPLSRAALSNRSNRDRQALVTLGAKEELARPSFDSSAFPIHWAGSAARCGPGSSSKSAAPTKELARLAAQSDVGVRYKSSCRVLQLKRPDCASWFGHGPTNPAVHPHRAVATASAAGR